MAEIKVKRTNFSGGMTTTGRKLGQENAYAFSQDSNIFKSPDVFEISPALAKVSGSTVDGQVLGAADGSPFDTNRYFYDDQGKIYRETSGGTWSTLQTTSSSNGEGLLVLENYLYYPTTTDMGRYGPLDGTPAFNDTLADWWIASQLQQTGGGTGATDYTTPTSISEAATARQTISGIDHDPVTAITIDVDVVGTGDWTVTLHDAANNELAAKTIANGSMATGDITFTFASAIRVKPGEDYHFHVTSTVADGGVDTDTDNDLEGAEFTVQFQTLISATYHPMIEHLNGFAFGNEHYIGYFDLATFEPNQIELAPGFEVRGITKKDEFIVAYCWRGQSFAKAEEARLYFWDGIASTYNYFTDVRIGAPNALVNYRNNLVGVYGNKGSLQAGNSPFQELADQIPKLTGNIEVLPGAIDTYQGRVVIGVAGVTDDSSGLIQGVYEYGSQTDVIPNALNFPYTISTSTTQGTSLKISMVKSFGEDLYVAWRDDSSYGVDKVTVGGSVGTTANFEDLIYDGGDPDRYMQATKVEVIFEPLASGESVTPKYQLDRAGSFTSGTTVSTVGATRAQVFINNLAREVEWGFGLGASGGTSPTVTACNFIGDDLSDESEAA